MTDELNPDQEKAAKFKDGVCAVIAVPGSGKTRTMMERIGVLMLTSERSEKSRLGTSIELAKLEVEQLYPTISMPVTIALFDLGAPDLPDENSVKGGEADGVSVQTVSQDTEPETNWEDWEPFP